MIAAAQDFGIISILGSSDNIKSPTAVWGRDTRLGESDRDAMGVMFGADVGDSAGFGGLGLSGIGEGGGDRGEGIGLAGIGTMFGGAGTCDGSVAHCAGMGNGWGTGHGRLGGTHKTRSPKVGIGTTQVSGRLPREVIRRIVRQNYGRMRFCYQQGLASNPNLAGRVSVRFVIGRNGAVSNAASSGSDLADSSVVSCVVRSFYGLSFPEPKDGIVRVVYPMSFNPA